MKTKLHRRTMLKGLLGGGLITVGLPPLEIFLNTHGDAYAAGGVLPKRFGLFYWGNGNHPDRWTPTGTGDQWELSEQLEPLRDVKDEISVVTGMNVKTGNAIPHFSGPAGILSGAPLIVRGGDDSTFTGPSIDQVIAAEVGGETRFKSLEFGADAKSGLSFNGPDSRNPPERSPRGLFDRVFGRGFQLPGQMGMVDPKLGLRRGVLDAVMADASRLQSRLGAKDKTRLDQHLTGVRELERRIARLQEDPPNLDACALPPEPDADYPPIEGRPQLSELNRAFCDTIAMVLACDQTRVFSNFLSYPVTNILYPGASAGHHRLTHDEPGDQPEVNRIVKLNMAELAYLIATLRAVPEGGGTLLDNCAILATTDVSFARTHSLEDYPIITAGTACGALKTGVHYRSGTGENATKVIVTLLRAMGLRIAEFGLDEGKTSQGLSAIEA